MKALICMVTLQNTNFTNLPAFKVDHMYLSLFKKPNAEYLMTVLVSV